MCGTTPSFTTDENVRCKVQAMASDAIFNVSRGSVRPWKNVAMGLGFSALTGSKLGTEILSREGHAINYTEIKGLETEFAYAVTSEYRDSPDGIHPEPNLATACAWDNNDANMETLDGKSTLHATVGHTYQNIVTETNERHNVRTREDQCGRNRRKFMGDEREVPPFRKPITAAIISCPSTAAGYQDGSATSPRSTVEIVPRGAFTYSSLLTNLDVHWFFWSITEALPMLAGFVSKFIKDKLPLQRICYMDPIGRSPTNNDVV